MFTMGPTVTGGPPALQLGVSKLRLGHQEWPLVISANAALGLARPAAGPHRTRTGRIKGEAGDWPRGANRGCAEAAEAGAPTTPSCCGRGGGGSAKERKRQVSLGPHAGSYSD